MPKKTRKKASKFAKHQVKQQLKYPKNPLSKGKYFYSFGNGKAEGSSELKELLGGKGAGLADMTKAGAPVPPGFTISTEVCQIFYKNNLHLPREFDNQMEKYLEKVERIMNSKFGDSHNPLLVSVRSGAKFSMPGMMDTILNLGLNEKTVQGMIKKTNNSRFVYDCYRRFIQMFGNVVLGIDKSIFEEIIRKKKEEKKVKLDSSLSIDDLKSIVEKFKKKIRNHTGEEFPQDPWEQLKMARDAVFRSWNNPRAITYRRLNNISSDLGTAVNIQAMVFGNMGENSYTGVGFTRDPSTGEKKFYGEYLSNAQGEDVVAGIRTPKPISELKKEQPKVYEQLVKITGKLEKYYRDMQDFEFTVQEGKLFMLQTRVGKRTAPAAVKIAVDMKKEKLIDVKEAIRRIEPFQLEQLLHKRIDPKYPAQVIARGLAASPGAASGRVVFRAEDAINLASDGQKIILVRQETNPDDVAGMAVAQGILTARGGMTSHAAVVARGMGKSCIVGCEAIRVNEEKKQFIVGGLIVREREIITLNGTTGEVILGEARTIEPELSGEFATFMEWVDKIRKLGVRTNADTPKDAATAVKFGAEGIGLCRTEHMFFAPERVPIVQEMILAKSQAEREVALEKLLPLQKADFKAIFEIMGNRPVTIRTLDPPLHEFLPRKEELLTEIAELKAKGEDEKVKEKEALLQRVEELFEFNPMLGHRGCRLGITYPEITRMQAKAIFDAACELVRQGVKVVPEVMIPLVGDLKEFLHQREIVDKAAGESMKKYKVRVNYLVGTMIEVPRAALVADQIAQAAQFFSFGTNDLTQMTYGFSRDDAGKFLKSYLEKDILGNDPFVTVDESGVGQLMDMTIKKGRAAQPDLKIGICGEQGGDPQTIEFCHKIGLDYVSCSPYRVPVARLSAAQAVVGKAAVSTA